MQLSAKKAIIWPGGGSYGAVQAGAAEVLDQAGVLAGADLTIANSVGNLNQGIYVKGLMEGTGSAHLRKLWLGLKGAGDILSPDFTPIAAHPALHPVAIAELCNGAVFNRGAFDTRPLVKLIYDTMGELDTKEVLDRLGLTVRSIGYHDSEGKGRLLAGLMWKMMLGSCAIEVAFPARFGFSDGGPVANNPVRWAIAAGAKQIVVIYTGGPVDEMPEEPFIMDDSTVDDPILARDVAGSLLSNITQMNEAQAEQDVERARAAGVQVLEVYTKKPVEGSILNFDPDVLAIRWAQGQVAGQEGVTEARALGWIV